MRLHLRRFRPMTHYQRVKHRAALRMTIIGIVLLVCTLPSFLFFDLAITLFIGGSSLGFLLVGFQQEIDAVAAANGDLERRESDGWQNRLRRCRRAFWRVLLGGSTRCRHHIGNHCAYCNQPAPGWLSGRMLTKETTSQSWETPSMFTVCRGNW